MNRWPIRTAVMAVAGLGMTLGAVDAQAVSGVRYDFPARPLHNDFPAQRLLAEDHAAGYKTTLAQILQCGTFALWRTDDNLHLGDGTTANRLRRAMGWHTIDASLIDDAARRAGYRVDHTPAIGALGVMERNRHGAGKGGHVVYISQIDTIHHRMRIEDYNWRPYSYTIRVLNWSDVDEVVHFNTNG